MADALVCPPTTDDRGKSSDDPCTMFWCGGADYDAWKKKSQERIGQALMRQDLPANIRAQLNDWNQQVELLPRSKVDSGDAVRMMASIAKQAECIALAPSIEQLPPLVQVEKKPEWYKRKEVWIIVGVLGIGAVAAAKFGLFSMAARRFRRGKKK